MASARAPRRLDLACAALCIGVLGVTVLYPTARMVAEAFREGNLATLVSARGREATVNTFLISALSVLFAGLLGVPLAFLIQRFRFPGRTLLAGFAYLPLALPPLVGTLAFYYIFGRDGFLVRGAARFFGADDLAVPGPLAILLVHAYSFYVYFYAMTLAALERADPSLVEAARSLGAGPWRAFFRVTLPLLRPALMGAALLVFMSSAASFSAPYFFGEGYPMLSVEIFNAHSNYQQGDALSLTLLLALVSLLGVLVFRSSNAATSGGSKGTPRVLKGSARLGAGAAAWLGIAVLLLPHAAIFAFAFTDHRAWQDEILPVHYTTEHFVALFQDPGAFAPIRNSLWASAIATVAAIAIGLPAAYLIARRRPAARAVELLIMLPWALPATVIAIDLIMAFNNAALPLYNTIWLLPLAYFVRTVPMCARMLTAAIAPFDTTLIEAARSLGARPAYVFLRVVLPLLAPSVFAAAALAFATSLGEFAASVLIYVPENIPISVRINMEWRSAAGPAFAYSVLLTLLVAAAFVASRRMTNRML